MRMTLLEYIFSDNRLIDTQYAAALECIDWYVNNDDEYVDLETCVSYRQSATDAWDFDSFNLAATFDLQNQSLYFIFGNNLGDGMNEKFSFTYSPDMDIAEAFQKAKSTCKDKAFLELMHKHNSEVGDIVSALSRLVESLNKEVSQKIYVRVTKHNPETFSNEYPVGSEVYYQPIKGEDTFELTKVKSPAWRLGHGEIVAKIEGRAGGVLISHLYTPLA